MLKSKNKRKCGRVSFGYFLGCKKIEMFSCGQNSSIVVRSKMRNGGKRCWEEGRRLRTVVVDRASSHSLESKRNSR